jgi:hypothetical protein
MLVKFSTRYGQVLLLGESAIVLLRLGGHSGSVPGAVLSADLPEFLRHLRAGLAEQGDSPSPPAAVDAQPAADEDDSAPDTPVTLRMRSVPFVDLLDTAIARGSDLMWEEG